MQTKSKRRAHASLRRRSLCSASHLLSLCFHLDHNKEISPFDQHSKILSVFESCFRHHLNHSHATIFSFFKKCQKAATFGDYPLKRLVRLSLSSVPPDVSPALVELLIFKKSWSSRFSWEIAAFQKYRLNENDWMRSWDRHWQSHV